MFFIAFIFLSSVAGNTLSVEVTVFIVLLFQNEKFILNIELVDNMFIYWYYKQVAKTYSDLLLSASGSVVEHLLAKEGAAGSTRKVSIFFL